MIRLFKIQQELKVGKNQYNSFGGYKFRSAEDILTALKPLCKETETSIIINDELVSIGERYYIKAVVSLVDVNTGKTIAETTAYAREEENKKGMDGSQITGASSSYARKYALNAMFMIDDVKDSDSTNTHEKSETSVEEHIAKINKCKTLTALVKYFNENQKEFNGNQEIMNALSKRKQELKEAKSDNS